MLWFWNKQEIYMGYCMEKFRAVRTCLEEEKIKYDYKVINRNEPSVLGSNRGRSGSFGIPTEMMYTYYIYVNKKDYEQACCVIREVR